MASHIASQEAQEAQELAEQRVFSFRACRASEQYLASGENAVADLAILAGLKGARQGFRQGGLVAVGQGAFQVEAGRHARSGKGVDVCMAMQAPCLVNVIALPAIAEQQL